MSLIKETTNIRLGYNQKMKEAAHDIIQGYTMCSVLIHTCSGVYLSFLYIKWLKTHLDMLIRCV